MLTVQGPDGKPVQIPQNAAMQSLQHAQFNTNNTNIRGGKYREPMNQQSPKENINGDNNAITNNYSFQGIILQNFIPTLFRSNTYPFKIYNLNQHKLNFIMTYFSESELSSMSPIDILYQLKATGSMNALAGNSFFDEILPNRNPVLWKGWVAWHL